MTNWNPLNNYWKREMRYRAITGLIMLAIGLLIAMLIGGCDKTQVQPTKENVPTKDTSIHRILITFTPSASETTPKNDTVFFDVKWLDSLGNYNLISLKGYAYATAINGQVGMVSLCNQAISFYARTGKPFYVEIKNLRTIYNSNYSISGISFKVDTDHNIAPYPHVGTTLKGGNINFIFPNQSTNPVSGIIY